MTLLYAVWVIFSMFMLHVLVFWLKSLVVLCTFSLVKFFSLR